MCSNVKLVAILVGSFALSCFVAYGHGGMAGPGTDQGRFPWAVTVEKWGVFSTLKGDRNEMQYDGNVRKQVYERKPGSGMVFLIFNLVLEKQAKSTVNFSWKDVYIQDFKGERHYRHRDDGFLELAGMKRIRAVDLNFGQHRGSVCFEVSQQVAKEALNFVHETPVGRNVIRLK
jgi:hypothetical protein